MNNIYFPLNRVHKEIVLDTEETVLHFFKIDEFITNPTILPKIIWKEIFSYLDNDTLKCRTICKYFYAVIPTPFIKKDDLIIKIINSKMEDLKNKKQYEIFINCIKHTEMVNKFTTQTNFVMLAELANIKKHKKSTINVHIDSLSKEALDDKITDFEDKIRKKICGLYDITNDLKILTYNHYLFSHSKIQEEGVFEGIDSLIKYNQSQMNTINYIKNELLTIKTRIINFREQLAVPVQKIITNYVKYNLPTCENNKPTLDEMNKISEQDKDIRNMITSQLNQLEINMNQRFTTYFKNKKKNLKMGQRVNIEKNTLFTMLKQETPKICKIVTNNVTLPKILPQSLFIFLYLLLKGTDEFYEDNLQIIESMDKKMDEIKLTYKHKLIQESFKTQKSHEELYNLPLRHQSYKHKHF